MGRDASSRAGLIIAAGTLTSRVLGLLRAIVLVYAIGSLGISADAFATAGKVPNTIYTLIATGALTAVLVPQITKAALAADGGQRYINKLVTLAIAGASIVTVLAAALTPLLIEWLGASWSPAQRALATAFAFWLLPQVLFFSMYTVLGEVLNARSLFGPNAWTPVLNNVINIAGLITFVMIFGADPDGLRSAEAWNVSGVALVAGSATLGVAVQALALFAFWKRAGLSFAFDFKFRGIGLGTMGRVAGWTFLTVLVTQAVGLVNSRVMNLAQPGEAGLAASDLAGIIFVLPHAIIIISLVTARFTRMSENVHAGNMSAFVADISTAARFTSFAMVFFTSAMLVLAFPLIRLVQPAASYSVVEIVTYVLIANLIGLVAFSLLFVFNRGFFALSDTRTPFFISLAQSVLTLIASIIIAVTVPSSLVTISLTIVVSLLITAQAITTFFVLRGRVGRLGGRALLRGLAQNVVAGAVAALAGWGVLHMLGGIGESSFAMTDFFSAFIACALVTIAMALVYGIALLAFRSNEAHGLLRKFIPRR